MTTKTTLEQLHTQLDELRSELRGAERKAEFTRLENEAEERNARRDGRMPEIDEWYVYKLEWAADEIRAQIEIVKNQIHNLEMEAWLAGGYKDDPDYVAPDDNDSTPEPNSDDTADSETTMTTETTHRNPEIEAKYKATLDKIISLFEVTEHGLIVLRSALPNNAPINKLQEAGYIRFVYINHIAPDYGLLAYWQATDPDGFDTAYTAIKEVYDVRGILRITRERMDAIASDDNDPTPAPDGDDTADSDDVSTEPTEPTPTPSDNSPTPNDPAPVLAEIMDWVAWNVENFGADGTQHSVDLLPNINLDGLGKWLRVRKGVVYFRLAWWQLLAQDNPAMYHRALRNFVLEKAVLAERVASWNKIPHQRTHAQKQRRAYRRLDRIYRTVSRYKYGVE